ncbi:HNH endonuclease [Rhodoferax sp. TH121]|uniref:HNH endonuclease n=1 Tax=Rhodoferax sp. TH121 TaxID=2022803 RepID=UPI0034E8768F
MWLEEDAEVLTDYLGLEAPQVKLLRCTAEHLHARTDGGTNAGENIAAACYFCNSRRHRQRHDQAPEPDDYRARVKARMASGHWHPALSALGRWGS